MKRTTVTIKVFYSLALATALSCSSADPKSTSTKTGTSPVSPATTTTTTSTTKTADDATTSKTADATDQGTSSPTATPTPNPTPAPAAAALTFNSTAFAADGIIPTTYVATAKGGTNASPPLQWKNPPAGTSSFVIQMVDLDFQNPPFIHWLITSIPAASTSLPAGIAAGSNLAAPPEAVGASQPKGYGGPNPPAQHRYEWTIYAIKQGQTLTLGTNSATNRTELEGKSLSKASFIGKFP
jgi:Raf kinase inhibitor-like YbhB/YbcL family protein